MNKNIKCTITLAIFLSAIIRSVVAGPNAGSHIYLDNDFRSAQIESSLQNVSIGDTCYIAVYIDHVTGLNSYSAKLQFDSGIVAFCEADVKKSFSEKPFLECSGGKLISLVNSVKGDVEIAVALKGTGLSVSGNGCLGYFTFKCIKSGNPAITIKEVKLVDSIGTVDTLP